jgi:hypothetical protein
MLDVGLSVVKLRRNDDVEDAAVSRSVTQGGPTRQKKTNASA